MHLASLHMLHASVHWVCWQLHERFTLHTSNARHCLRVPLLFLRLESRGRCLIFISNSPNMTINSGYLFENSHFSVPFVLWRFTAMAVHRTLIGRDERIGTTLRWNWSKIGMKRQFDWSTKETWDVLGRHWMCWLGLSDWSGRMNLE